jgi:hypothetical protein
MGRGFLVSRGMATDRGPHMTCHVGWWSSGEENEPAVAPSRTSRVCEADFGQTSRIETALGDPCVGVGCNGAIGGQLCAMRFDQLASAPSKPEPIA